MRLNYRHLYYFMRVAESGKLTDVAKELHISQSALSTQIKQLEHQVGDSLFDRRGRLLVLTELGRNVLGYARDIFAKGKELEGFLDKGGDSEAEHISIGVLTNLSRNFVESFIAPLFAHPEVTFSLQSRRLDYLLNGLNKQEFDLILTNCTVIEHNQQANWQQQLVAKQPLAILGPTADIPNTSFPHGYEDKLWVLPSINAAIRSAFEFYCAGVDFTPNIKAEIDDMAMLRLVARDSKALAVLPPVVVKDEIDQGKLAIYHTIPDAHEAFYAISITNRRLPSVVNELLNSAALQN